jgi:hypothetical protein
MALFVLVCIDKSNSLDLRLATRQAHLAYASQFSGITKLGGPFLDDDGQMAGSLIILDVEDKAAAQAFTDNDPYTKAGLFERVEVRAFRATLGQL